MAIGYLTGKTISKATQQNQNIPLFWTMSILPDIDLLIPSLLHRGPTHSIVIASLVFAPFLILKPKQAFPYFAVLATHELIGDYFVGGGSQLLWPLSTDWIGFESYIAVGSIREIAIEIGLFILLTVALIISKDYKQLFRKDKKNIILFIPMCTILLPAMFRFPIYIPQPLIVPHIILLIMIIASLLYSTKYIKELILHE